MLAIAIFKSAPIVSDYIVYAHILQLLLMDLWYKEEFFFQTIYTIENKNNNQNNEILI